MDTNKKVWFVGDLHGCIRHLEEAIKRFDLDNNDDVIVFLGDYIDRGEDAWAVVKTLQNLQKKYGKSRIICLMGNHEKMIIDACEECITNNGIENRFMYSKMGIWLANGGFKTIESYEKRGEKYADDLEWFKSLPLYYKEGEFIGVHAGLKPHKDITEQNPFDMLWIREEFFESDYEWEEMIVYGHTYTKALTVSENGCIGIDTGCFFTGVLTIFNSTDLYWEEITLPTIYELDNRKNPYDAE